MAEQPGSPLSAGRKLVKLTFGRVHESTPASFIYRKLLCALGKAEQGTDDEARRLVRKIRRVYSDPELDGDRFLAFLDQHPDRYGEVVFLIDKLPRLLKMETQTGEDFKGMQAFWQDLDELQDTCVSSTPRGLRITSSFASNASTRMPALFRAGSKRSGCPV